MSLQPLPHGVVERRGRQQSMGGDVQMQAPANRPTFEV